MGDLTFRTLRGANTARQPEQAGKAKADVPFRTVEFAAASGQLAEVIRQLLRVDRSNKGGSAILADVASRMGEVVLVLDLLAIDLGIDLDEATRKVFNTSSEKQGFRTYISYDGNWYFKPELPDDPQSLPLPTDENLLPHRSWRGSRR